MANVTVEIHCDEQGQYSVGIEPEGQEQVDGAQTQGGDQPLLPAQGEAQGGESNLKPVKSLEEALQVARDLLQGETGQQAQQAEKDFSKGFQGPAAGGY